VSRDQNVNLVISVSLERKISRGGGSCDA
jgi:hypothetical protein